MQLFIGKSANDWSVQKHWVSSFVLFDRQSMPTAVGVEYTIEEGILRTFSSRSEPDFLDVLNRSGMNHLSVPGIVYGVPCLLCVPFLGKGVPEWTAGVFRLLAANDKGKHLFAAIENTAGVFESAMCGDAKFDAFLRSVFG